MNTPSGFVTVDSLQVAPGSGVLVRRNRSLLFLSHLDDDSTEVIDSFVGAPESDVIEAVTDTATAARFELPPFVVLTWTDQLHLVVFGPIEVATDHLSLPMLSGAGSASWVERRLRLGTGAVSVQVGGKADPASDLQLGRVHADGFAATFVDAASGEPPSAAEPATAAAPVQPVETARPVEAAQRVVAQASSPPVVDPTGPIGGDRLAALRAAMRSPDVDAIEEPHQDGDGLDDEVTLAPNDPPPERTPQFEPSDLRDDAIDDDEAPFVAAIRCERGHVNPTHVGVCQTCGDLLDAGAPHETVRQPPLATLELAGGDSIPIDRALVLGRRPDLEAAQAPPRALSVVVADDASVSRTHLRIDVEDWSLTVTDCGSRSGTAIVTRPGEEPRILESWMAHELPIGARLFLGGPTSVIVRSIPRRGGARG